MKDEIDLVDYLARSATRVKLLEALYKHGPLKKNELNDYVDASRTTIQRNLDALEEKGWIRDNNCEYWITRSGDPVAEQFLALLDTIAVARKFEPLLKWLPTDSFGLEVQALTSADLTVADSGNPYAPVNRHVDLMQSTGEFRCLLPAVGLQPMLIARDCVAERGHEHEIVVDPDVAETLATDPNYRGPVKDLSESSLCNILVSERPVPFYLGLGDDTVQIGVGDDDEVPRSLAESSTPDVREWAEQTFADYRADAEPLTTGRMSTKTA